MVLCSSSALMKGIHPLNMKMIGIQESLMPLIIGLPYHDRVICSHLISQMGTDFMFGTQLPINTLHMQNIHLIYK